MGEVVELDGKGNGVFLGWAFFIISYSQFYATCHLYKVIPHAGPLPTALLKTQVQEWEKQGKPDPCNEHMMHFMKVLKTSHAEAQSDFKSSEGSASWFPEPEELLC